MPLWVVMVVAIVSIILTPLGIPLTITLAAIAYDTRKIKKQNEVPKWIVMTIGLIIGSILLKAGLELTIHVVTTTIHT